MKNLDYNKLRSYPQKTYWLDTDGLMSERSYKKSFKRNQKHRVIRRKLKQKLSENSI